MSYQADRAGRKAEWARRNIPNKSLAHGRKGKKRMTPEDKTQLEQEQAAYKKHFT